MEKRKTWLAATTDALCDELSDRGHAISRDEAENYIRKQRDRVAKQLGISNSAAQACLQQAVIHDWATNITTNGTTPAAHTKAPEHERHLRLVT